MSPVNAAQVVSRRDPLFTAVKAAKHRNTETWMDGDAVKP